MKQLFAVLSLTLLTNFAFGQNKTSCFEIQGLINFRQILENFRIFNHSDTLVLIDKNRIASADCSFLKWGHNKILVTNDSLLIHKSIKGGSAAFFKGQCQYFVIDSFKRKGNKYLFTIFHGCSNEFIDCNVLKMGKKFRLIEFRGGVY